MCATLSPPQQRIMCGCCVEQSWGQLFRYMYVGTHTYSAALFHFVFGAQVKFSKSLWQSLHNNNMISAVCLLCYVFAALQTILNNNELPPRRPPSGGLFIFIVIIIVITFFFKNFFFNLKYKSSRNSRGWGGGGGEEGTKRLGAHAEYIMCEHARFTLARLNVYYNDGVYRLCIYIVHNIKIYFIVHCSKRTHYIR